MFEKNLKVTYLLDFYGDVLDEHTRSVMKAYYDDDLSLSEIADGIGISRQGVRHLIKKGEEQLEFFEDRLGLSAYNERLMDAADTLSEIRSALGELSSLPDGICERLDAVIDTIKKN